METMIDTITSLMKKTAISFMVCVMLICMIGSIMNEQVTPISTLFQEGGVSYTTLLEVFSLSFIIAIVNFIFDYPKFMKKTLLLYKIIIQFVVVTLVTVSYIYIFGWFPFSNIDAWIGFIVTFSICFLSAMSITLYKTKKMNQKYQKLLQDYKKRGHNHERNTHRTHS